MQCPECLNNSYNSFGGCSTCGYRHEWWKKFVDHTPPPIVESSDYPTSGNFQEVINMLRERS